VAITAIKSIDNKLPIEIFVYNLENPDDTPGFLRIEPGATAGCSMWVPWCNGSQQFENGSNPFQGPAHITVYADAGEHPLLSIWQDNVVLVGDHVWYGTGEEYPGNPADRLLVLGNNTVGGDRSVEVVNEDGTPRPRFF
jgi:hypothetical protein